jgi:hypothetical protein
MNFNGIVALGLRWLAALAVAEALAYSPAARADSRLVKGPYMTSLSDTSVDVRFEMEHSLPASLTVTRDLGPGDAASGPLVFESLGSSELRVVRVAGLWPASRYTYTVRAGRVVIGGGHFTTAPRADAPAAFNFLVYGDNRTDVAAHAAVVRAMLDVPSDFLVSTGDLVADGASGADWQSFFDVEAPILRERALFVAIGNHELYEDAAGSNFAKYFGFIDATGSPSLYGTARIGNTRIFFLNAMHDWASGEERDWLVRELERADGEAGLAWRIAVTHQGPWSSGPHGPNANLVAAHVPELLRAHHVDLLLAGHDHIYERGDGDGLKYIVSGGGGAPLYRLLANSPATRKTEAAYHFVEVTVTAKALRIVARRVDGTILERCGFRKGGPWDCDPAPAPRDGPRAPEPSPSASSARCGCWIEGSPPGSARASLALVLSALALVRRLSRRPGSAVDHRL